ncbi:hypothetical protein ACGFI5_16860 [Micromonospora tulbaghiae]|uniref:Uncharacterized protein n=1 Tax=Micromonospora tulbaghiae TaxID=479978 RepID=A0ABY0KHL8_9ACTN|nr:hypothetical protein [Micromonospora tulbaghiae]MDX5459192.1 hypothetical protein [Micromonospora tulbaghiae]SCE74026.1 hypothetical protein GA0070562_2177 [Micromonospora tulbaghiae]
MATRIRDLFGGGKDRPEGVVQHTVGNALVVHAEDAISPEAQSLALSMIEDAENDVVVLDLGDGMPISAWEAMAGVLPRRRRGIRLIACGRHGNSAAMAGQWLSERLNRTVVAPDGDLVRGSAGTLFVHSAPGSGWVRFRPGRPPAWDAKRYPTPRWDRAAIDTRPSSATAEIEPIPAGVWIHSNRDPQVVDPQRQRLTAYVPCQAETMTVLLGCPGTAPLSLDDVVRFWRGLDEENRQRVRFVQFGEVRIPEGEAFGQALADLLNTEVTCYTGVPIGSPQRYEIRTVLPDGAFGWAPYALELSYSPRAHPNSRARRPTVLSHRPPLAGAEEVAPRVYWFAPGAVVEVVQTGLWVRSTAEPKNAEQVRSAMLDAGSGTLVFDDTVHSTAHRMRELAVDLAARVDGMAGAGRALMPASVLVPGAKPASRAEVVIDLEAEVRAVGTTVPVPAYVEVAPPAPVAPPAADSVVVAVPAPVPALPADREQATASRPASAPPLPAPPAMPLPVAPALPPPPVVPLGSELPAPPAVPFVSALPDPPAAPLASERPAPPAVPVPTAPSVGSELPPPPAVPLPAAPPVTADLPEPPMVPVVSELPAPPAVPLPAAPPVAPVVVAAHTPPVAHAVPATAAGPDVPVVPVAPVQPVTPVEPVTPVAPAAPAGPVAVGPVVAADPGSVPSATPVEDAAPDPYPAPPTMPTGFGEPAPPTMPAGFGQALATPPVAAGPVAPVAAPPPTAVDLPSVPSAGAGPADAAEPAKTAGPTGPTGQAEPAEDAEPSEVAAEARMQPVPSAGAGALLSEKKGLADERAWLRRTLSREFDVMASSVSRIMSEHPGMQGSGVSTEDVLADSVALRLYLTGRGPGVDAGLRSGRKGPHVPFARCVVAGVSRMPSFRGTTVYRLSPTDGEWALYQDRRLVTDWSFVNALTQPCASEDGDTDVLIWSMTARRTSLLEPEGDEHVEDRVLFLPGTNFKVLDLRRPSAGERGAVMLREIGANEIDDTGRVDSNRVSLDELAITSLRRSVDRWATAEPRVRIGAAARGRLRVLPGLDRKG